tara:strand:- start:413 stop:1198 length:786 start_codon:yes stop_codon:yes gene_type:complete
MGKIALLCGDTKEARHCAERFVDAYPDRVGFVCRIGDGKNTPKYDSTRNTLGTTCRKHGTLGVSYRNESRLLELINEKDVTTVVCIWWPHILKLLPHRVANIINTHPSLLPYNRGKYPYYWSIMDRTPFGVTIHRVDSGVDTGKILWQSEIAVTPEATGEHLYRMGNISMVHLFLANMPAIADENFPSGMEQDEEDATSHKAKDFDRDKPLDLDDYEHVGYLIDDLRARTFQNKTSGRRVEIDGEFYRVHLELVKESNEEA